MNGVYVVSSQRTAYTRLLSRCLFSLDAEQRVCFKIWLFYSECTGSRTSKHTNQWIWENGISKNQIMVLASEKKQKMHYFGHIMHKKCIIMLVLASESTENQRFQQNAQTLQLVKQYQKNLRSTRHTFFAATS